MSRRTIDLSKPLAAEEVGGMLAEQVEQTMKETVTTLMREITILTPVDTGRLRWGYFCTVNAPSAEMPPEGKYTIPPIDKRVADMGDFTVSDTLYVTNNVPYGHYLNDGTKYIAPRHFVERAVAITENAMTARMKAGNR